MTSRRVIFLDTETTGLSPQHDRIITLAMIRMDLDGAKIGDFSGEYIHIVCNPERRVSPHARQVNGFEDQLLRHQEPLANYIGLVEAAIAGTDLLVGHNVSFDLSFVNAELGRAGRPQVFPPTFCTMKTWRERIGGSAALDAAIGRIGLQRHAAMHSALEDAWLAAHLFFWFEQGSSVDFPFSLLTPDAPMNLVALPPEPPHRPRGRPRKAHE